MVFATWVGFEKREWIPGVEPEAQRVLVFLVGSETGVDRVRRAVDPRDCTLTWSGDTRTFSLVSSSDQACDPVTIDELGCGLQRFPVGVIDDKVIVFLNETQEEVDAALDANRDESDPAPVGPDLSCPEE